MTLTPYLKNEALYKTEIRYCLESNLFRALGKQQMIFTDCKYYRKSGAENIAANITYLAYV